MPDQALVYYDAARKALEKAATIDDVKKIRDQAETLRIYARKVGKNLELQNYAAEMKLRSERKAGEILGPNIRKPGQRDQMFDEQTFALPKLKEIGISRFQSHCWQRIAKIPEALFEEHIAEKKEGGEELTSIGIRKIARDLAKEKTRKRWRDADPSGHIQHFDIWQFGQNDGDTSFFGALPPQIMENLLWFFTEPGQIVVDPFAGSGTTIEVAKRMGRQVWASDRKPATATLPIYEHDITTGWPKDAPATADLIFLDPPYWKQAAARYSDDGADFGNMTLDEFLEAWSVVLKHCVKHLDIGGRLAFIVSPAEDKDADRVVDLALLMHERCRSAGLKDLRRIIVPYQTQQATGQQVTWARENRKLLKLYRDLVVMTR